MQSTFRSRHSCSNRNRTTVRIINIVLTLSDIPIGVRACVGVRVNVLVCRLISICWFSLIFLHAFRESTEIHTRPHTRAYLSSLAHTHINTCPVSGCNCFCCYFRFLNATIFLSWFISPTFSFSQLKQSKR